MIRVAIADDHSELLLALRLLLSLSADIEIVCEANNGQQAVDCVRHVEPDVLVMDIQMPVLDGLQATKQVVDLAGSTRVILISIYRGSYIARQAESAGARAFLPKDDLASSLREAVEAVYRGERFFIE